MGKPPPGSNDELGGSTEATVLKQSGSCASGQLHGDSGKLGASASSLSSLKGMFQDELQAPGNLRGHSTKPFDLSIFDTEVLRLAPTTSKAEPEDVRCGTPPTLRKAPASQIMLVPIRYVDVPRWTQSRGGTAASPSQGNSSGLDPLCQEQTLARAASSPGSIRCQEGAEDVSSASSLLKTRLLARKERMAARGPLRRKAAVPVEVQFPKPPFEEQPTVTAHYHPRRSSTNFQAPQHESDDDHPAGSRDDCNGFMLKDWFDSAEGRDRFGSGGSTTPSHAAGGAMLGGSSGSSADGDKRPTNGSEQAAAVAEQKREAIRRQLVRAVGGPLEAFRFIDVNRSQNISLTEFSDGLKRMGIDWQETSGFTKIQELFKLFDRNGKKALSLEELFPCAHLQLEADSQRLSTPEFWNHWCKRTGGHGENDRLRSPKWAPSSPDEELRVMCHSADQRQEVADERRRMSAMIRNLKKQGKSDAQCRECVAKHLPRGSGPKERDNVQTFSAVEVRSCRRAYNDPILSHVRNIQKSVNDMREKRKELTGSRQKLFTTMEPSLRAKKEEDAKKQGAAIFSSGHDSGLGEVARAMRASVSSLRASPRT